MRIVAGKHRGRRLAAPEGGVIRPTADRTRESLFNILLHAPFAGSGTWDLNGIRVLDAFAGSGALGLEALSRGAAHITFMDTATAALAAIRGNARALGEEDRITSLLADPGAPPAADQPCGLVLLDPPYGEGLAAPALAALADAGWIAPDAVSVVELGKAEPFDPPAGVAVMDERTYGAAKLIFLSRES